MVGLIVDSQVTLPLLDVQDVLDLLNICFLRVILSLFVTLLLQLCLLLGYLLLKCRLTALFLFFIKHGPEHWVD